MKLNESNLYPYQKTGRDHILENPFCGLFLDMGLGKTVITLTAINALKYQEIAISSALIVAPKRVAASVWSDEIDKWDHLRHLRISKVIGTEKKRKAALAVNADVYTIGRDNLAWLIGQYGGSSLPFDMVVLDESSSFKNHQAKRFLALKLVRPYIDRLILLTGTPAPNGLIDLWAQMYLLDMGDRLSKYITHYRDKYFYTDYTGFKYLPIQGAQEEIQEKIKDVVISMKAEDHLKDLPGREYNYIKIQFPPALQKKYNDFEKEKVLQLFEDMEEDEGISAVNAAALSTKLLQFANGAVYDEEKAVHEVHSLKLEAIEELIEAANGKSILVAWTYKHDRDRLMARLKKYSPVELKGEKEIRDWNAGKIQVMLMHPASGGHGLNLQFGGHIIVWFGQTWALELYQQFNARLPRPGQKNTVIIHHLIASKTIDEEVIAAQDRKSRGQAALIDAVKAKIKKYVEAY